MSIPGIQKLRIGTYILKNLILQNQRFPLVLMLEPSFRCNLSCIGCGKIDYPNEILERRLSVADCIEAAEECGAPVVSIPGGEPLLLPDIHILVNELIARKRFVYLCTNALLIEKRISDFSPSPYLTFNVHIDGLPERHDGLANREGVFDLAVSAVRQLMSQGFRVTTNTTFFNGETPHTAARLFDYLTGLGIEGMTIAPAFNYDNASSERNFFLDRFGTTGLFRQAFEMGKGKRWRFNHSLLYLQFLAGKQQYACTPWGTPTRNIFGWQRPCYLIDDGYTDSYRELMATTDWDRYGAGKDPRCSDCMVHCGFEPTAVMDSIKNPFKALRTYLKDNAR